MGGRIFTTVSCKDHLEGFRFLALAGYEFTATPKTAEALITSDVPRECIQVAQEIPHSAESYDIVVANLGGFNLKPRNLPAIDSFRISLIQSAARNYASVIVIVNPLIYESVVKEILSSSGISEKTRVELALAAVGHIALYEEGAKLDLMQKLGELQGQKPAKSSVISIPNREINPLAIPSPKAA